MHKSSWATSVKYNSTQSKYYLEQSITLRFFKVARVVKLKLVFMEWIFYNFVILIWFCKIQYLHSNKALLFPRNQAIYLKNWKLWRAPSTTKCNVSCWNFAHVFYLTMSTKGCSEFFLFCLDLELLIKM